MIQKTTEEKLFWALPASKVVEILETNVRSGLSESEAERRIKVFGPNVIEKSRGVEHEIDAAELVPGDIIHLAQGDRIPADGRLLFVNDLQIDEAILMGESLPVSKSVDPVNVEAVIGDQYPMVFAGTLVI